MSSIVVDADGMMHNSFFSNSLLSFPRHILNSQKYHLRFPRFFVHLTGVQAHCSLANAGELMNFYQLFAIPN